MKKTFLVLLIILCVNHSKAQIPTIVNDPLALGELVALGGSAVSQVTTLFNLLDIAAKQAEKLEKVTSVITFVADIQYIISTATSTLNSATRIINYVTSNKIINAQSALNYTGVCIYGTDNCIRHVNRLTNLISSTFSATPAERSAMINQIKNELEIEDKRLAEVDAKINHELVMRSTEMLMLKSQGLQ